jgi:hypothetical protein
MMIVTMVTWS